MVLLAYEELASLALLRSQSAGFLFSVGRFRIFRRTPKSLYTLHKRLCRFRSFFLLLPMRRKEKKLGWRVLGTTLRGLGPTNRKAERHLARPQNPNAEDLSSLHKSSAPRRAPARARTLYPEPLALRTLFPSESWCLSRRVSCESCRPLSRPGG